MGWATMKFWWNYLESPIPEKVEDAIKVHLQAGPSTPVVSGPLRERPGAMTALNDVVPPG